MEWIEIFDISLLRSLLRSTAPIAIVGMAAAICSAAGVLNIGLEGKMLNAAFAGVAASYYTESMWAGLAAGVIAGIMTAVLFGLLSFTLGADEVLAGLAINILSLAGTTYLMRTLFGQAGFFSDPKIVCVEPIYFTFLEGTFLEPFLSGFTYSVYLMFFIAAGLHILYYRTRL